VFTSITPFADFGFTAACKTDSVRFTAVPVPGASSYDWDFGDFSSGTGQNAVHLYTAAGVSFAVELSVTLSGCVDRITRNVVVFPVPAAAFTGEDVCLGEQVHFINTTSVPDAPGSLGSLSYHWSFGNGDNSTDINPVYLYDDTFDIFTVTLRAVSSDGCRDSFSNTIIVFPLPIANFTFGATCFDQPIGFGNLDDIAYGRDSLSYHWDFGDGTTSYDSLPDPPKKYSSLGTFQVTHTVTSNQGCVDDTTRFLTIFPNPTANFFVTNNCERDTTQFNNLSTISAGDLSFSWEFGDGFNSTGENPKHVYSTAGSYPVELTVTSDTGCVDVVTKSIVVYPKPTVEFFVAPVCRGNESQFIDSSSVPQPSTIAIRNWNFGDGGASLDKDPRHLYEDDDVYSVTLTVTTDKGCVNTGSEAAVVFANPVVIEIFATNQPKPFAFCDGDNARLVAIVDPPDTYDYEWDDPQSTSDSLVVVTEPGTYCVTATDPRGCASDTCVSVFVYDLPAVTAVAIPGDTSKGFPVQLNADVSGFGQDTTQWTYAWSADESDATISDPNSKSPVATLQQTTTFTVTVTDENGCTFTSSVVVGVREDYQVIPLNVITPNGDNMNDRWDIRNILPSYPDNQVLIFDRWGTKVFDMANYDNSWDGTYNGKDLPQGTYYYVIRFDGNERLYKGAVSILR